MTDDERAALEAAKGALEDLLWLCGCLFNQVRRGDEAESELVSQGEIALAKVSAALAGKTAT